MMTVSRILRLSLVAGFTSFVAAVSAQSQPDNKLFQQIVSEAGKPTPTPVMVPTPAPVVNTVIQSPAPAVTPAPEPMMDDSQMDIHFGLPTDTSTPTLVIAFNSFRRSSIEPCGCISHKLGGIDREASLIERLKAKKLPYINLEGGGVLKDASSDVNRTRTEYALQAFGKIGYDVINVGYHDLGAGPDFLKSNAEKNKLKLISANVVDATGKPMFPAFEIFERKLADGSTVKIAVVGATSVNSTSPIASESHGAPTTSSQYLIKEPLPILKDMIAGLKKQANMVILMHYDTRRNARELVMGLPEGSRPDVLMAGQYEAVYRNSDLFAGVQLISGGFEGRYAGVAVAGFDKSKLTGFSAQLFDVVQTIPARSELTALIAKMNKQLSGDEVATDVTQKK